MAGERVLNFLAKAKGEAPASGTVMGTPSRRISAPVYSASRPVFQEEPRGPLTPSAGQLSDDNRIHVCCRVRPPNASERAAAQEGEVSADTMESTSRCLAVLPDAKSVVLSSKPTARVFTFDFAASEQSTQEEVFAHVGKPISAACLEGYNGTIFAYGQTGSGKTHTMFGKEMESLGQDGSTGGVASSSRGLLPRSLDYLFREIERESRRTNGRVKYTCHCSFFEIFNERVFDLLDAAGGEAGLNVREDQKKGVYVENLGSEQVDSSSSAGQVLLKGYRNRRVAETAMNRESSRSHAVFQLLIESVETVDPATTPSKRTAVVPGKARTTKSRSALFNLVDLAGSERQKSTKSSGDRLKEAVNINRSLSALGQVINALVDRGSGKARHVHYRDSKLTFLLRDSLGGNSRTFLVATVSPGDESFGESLSTLKFAQRAKMIQNEAVVNEDVSGSMDALKLEVKRLQQEVAAHKALNSSREAGDGSVASNRSCTPEEAAALKETQDLLPEATRRFMEARNQAERMQKKISGLRKITETANGIIVAGKLALKLSRPRMGLKVPGDPFAPAEAGSSASDSDSDSDVDPDANTDEEAADGQCTPAALMAAPAPGPSQVASLSGRDKKALEAFERDAASVLELVKYRAACDFYREQLEMLVEPALRASNPFLAEPTGTSARKSLGGGGRKSFGGGSSDTLAERVRAEEKAIRTCRDMMIGLADHHAKAEVPGAGRWIGRYWSGPEDAKFAAAFEKEYLKVRDERDDLLEQLSEAKKAARTDTSLMERVEEDSFSGLSQSFDEPGPVTRSRKNRRKSMGGRMSIGGAGMGGADVSSKQWADKKACEKEVAAEKLKTEAAQQELAVLKKANADAKCELLEVKREAAEASTKERKEREDLERQLASCRAALDTAEALAKEKREEAQETNSTASELTAQVEELKLANAQAKTDNRMLLEQRRGLEAELLAAVVEKDDLAKALQIANGTIESERAAAAATVAQAGLDTETAKQNEEALRHELDVVRQTVADLEVDVSTAEQAAAELKGHLQAAQDREEALQAKLQGFEEEIETAGELARFNEAQNATAKAEISGLERKLASTTSELEQATATIEEKERAAAELAMRVRESGDANDARSLELAAVSASLQQATEEAALAAQSLSESQSRLAEESARAATLQARVEEVEEESGMRAAVNHDLTEEVTTLRDRLVEAEAAAEGLSLELTTVTEDRDEVAESLDAAEAEAEAARNELEHERAGFREELEKQHAMTEAAEAAHKEALARLAASEAEWEVEVQAEIRRHEEALAGVQAALAKKSEEVLDLQAELEGLRQNQKQDGEEQEKDLVRMQVSVREAEVKVRAALTEAKLAAEARERAEAEVQQLKAAIEAAEAAVEADAARVATERRQLEDELESSDHKCDELIKEIDRLSTNIAKSAASEAALAEQVADLATQLDQMNEQAEAWKVEQETSRAEVAKCREMELEAHDRATDMESSMALLSQQLADEEERCRKLRETVTKLTGHGNNKQKISLHLNLKKEINELQLQNKQLQRDLQRAKQKNTKVDVYDDATGVSCGPATDELDKENERETGNTSSPFAEIESF